MSTFILGTWNFWWVLEGSWFASLPWSVIDWWIHNPNESPKTEFYNPMIQPLLLLDSGIGPRLTRILFLRQKCESCYIEDVWNFRKTSPNHPFQCFTFIVKPHGILVASPQQPHESLEKEVQTAVETTNGEGCKMNLPCVQPSSFFRGLNLMTANNSSLPINQL